MNSSAAFCIVAAGLCACASGPGPRQSTACAPTCIIELTNGTMLDLDVRVAQRAGRAVVHEHLGPGESRQVVLESADTPVVTVAGARSASMTRRLSVRVRCATPTRNGDTFRSECRLASVSAVPGDSAPGQPPPRSVQ